MALWTQFIGPAYRARSQNIADDALINLYPEFSENPAGAKQATYYGTPGLKPFTTLDTQSSRGWFSQDGRTFAVVGNTVYGTSASAPPVSASVDLLIVGAGGGGASGGAAGNGGGGGGGAGGLVTDTRTMATGAFTVTVGTGGAGSVASNLGGTAGGSSLVTGSTTATGGGGGGSAAAGVAAAPGGCGGGAGDAGGAFASGGGGTQGSSGGANSTSGGVGGAGGGGGGMGSAGTDASGGGTNPAGGTGLANSLSGGAVTYAAGGRGGSRAGGETGPTGTANSGNGGGGGGGGTTGPGGTGADGVVILSYVTGGITATGGTITMSGGRTIHTFTISGTFTVSSGPSLPSSGSDDFVVLGTIPNDGLPVSFASNGRGGEQVALVGGGQLKIINLRTNVLSAAITLPLTNAPVMVDFLDGYFVLSEADTIRVWFSALEDGTSWDALDFFAVSLTSSNVVGIKVFRDRIWVFQSQSSLVYYDSGDSDNPFVPYPGSVMQEGCVTPWSIVVLGEQIFWLAQDNQGRNRIVSAVDYAPVVISTPPISFALASYSTTTDCEALAYEQEGHPFACWTVGDHTWCYDTRTQQWHERSTYDVTTGLRHRWRARGSCATDTGIIVGDAVTGDVYTLDLDTFTDNGATIQRLRRAPYLSAENQWMFIDRFELGIQSGVGLVDGREPELMLSLSRDSGHTWTPPTTTTMGAMGNYLARAIWRKLGRVRADRLVVEITQTDPVRAVWGPGAYIRARPGSGQL